MGDFYQNGIITTLHNLSRRPVEELEAELLVFSPAALHGADFTLTVLRAGR